jgi:death-associated protein kinase
VTAFIKSGQYPIHYATQRNHITAIEIYSGACRNSDERKAVLNCQDKDGRTPLHVAVQCKKLEAVTALCTLGADLYVTDDPKGNPRTPLDCARAQNPHSAISQYLEQAVNRLDVLLDALSLETNDVKIVKLLVCGHPEMGKTQLCRSLIRSPSLLTILFGRSTSLFNPTQRTPGIDVENINIPGVGLMSIWDFAGHMQYYVSHSLFLGSVNAIFCIVTSLQKLRTKQEEYLRFWLEFIILARRSSNVLAKENKRPIVMIIASHSDAPDKERPLRGRHLKEHLDMKLIALKRALERLRAEFAAELTIVNDLFCMDCRDAASPDMNRLRQCLAQYRNEVLKNLKPAPMLARQILDKMPMWRKEMGDKKLLPLLTYDKFTNYVHDVNQHATNEVINVVMKYLHHCGEIIQVEKELEQMSIPWLVFLMPVHLCRELIGRFLSPAEFHIDRIEVDTTGCVPKATVINIFKRYWTNVGDVIPVFEQLDLCYYTDKEKATLCIPALVTISMPSDAWDKLGPNAIYAGRRFEYTRKASIFAYGQLSRLIVQLHKQHNLLNIPVWCEGLTFRTGRIVQVMVRLMPNSKGIDLVVQAPPSERDEDNAYEAAVHLEHIAEEIEAYMTEFRQEYNNKNYDVFVPSIEELKKSHGLQCDRFFPMADVRKALYTPMGIVDSRGRTPESAVNLLFCGCSELIELPPAPDYEECSLRMLPHPVEEVVLKEFDPMSALFKDWRMMAGEALGLLPHQIDKLFKDHANDQSTTGKLMSIWAQRGGLIKDLLKFLHDYGKDYTADLVQVGLDAYVRAGGRGHEAARAACYSLERYRCGDYGDDASNGSPDLGLLASNYREWRLSSDFDNYDGDGQVLGPMCDPHPPSPPSSVVLVTNNVPDTHSSVFFQLDSRTVDTDGTNTAESQIPHLLQSQSRISMMSTNHDILPSSPGSQLVRPMPLDSSTDDLLTESTIQIICECAGGCWLDIGRTLIGQTQDVHHLIQSRSMGMSVRDSKKLYWIIEEWRHNNNGRHATLLYLLQVLGNFGKREFVERELSRRDRKH